MKKASVEWRKVRGRTKPASGDECRSTLNFRIRKGIGRMELIVVIVLAVCILVCLPQFVLEKRSAQKKQQSTYQFRKLGLAVSHYHETYRAFPQMKQPKSQPRNKAAAARNK